MSLNDEEKKINLSLFNKFMKQALDLPINGSSDENIYRDNLEFKKIIKGLQTKLAERIQDLIDNQDGKANIIDKTEKKTIEDKFNIIVEVNDRILDRNNLLMNEIENPDNSESKNKQKEVLKKEIEESYLKILRTYEYNKQLKFTPLITTKPNALVPLDKSLQLSHHPYGPELERFTPPQSQLMTTSSQLFTATSFSETPLEFIDDVSQLEPLLSKLNSSPFVAVDLEHNWYRSYLGMTCLMQISIPTSDFIIDTLKLYDHLHILNEVFTDPNILKIFHGSKSDLMWLQRDFGLYIVNLFDTGVASEQLKFKSKSLAYLLSTICEIDVNKEHQLADWRIRPLSSELLNYARTDTHYLGQIYQELRSRLSDAGLLKEHYELTRRMCLETYEMPQELSHEEIEEQVARCHFNPRQKYAFQKLWKLRYRLAQEVDESAEFVLEKRVMINMARTLPKDTSGILNCGSFEKKNHLLMKYKMDFLKVCLDAYDEKVKVDMQYKHKQQLMEMESGDNFSRIGHLFDIGKSFSNLNFVENVSSDYCPLIIPVSQNLKDNIYGDEDHFLKRYFQINNPNKVKIAEDVGSVNVQEEVQAEEQEDRDSSVEMEAEVKKSNLPEPLLELIQNERRKSLKTVGNVVPFDYKDTVNKMRNKFCKRKNDDDDDHFKVKKHKRRRK